MNHLVVGLLGVLAATGLAQAAGHSCFDPAGASFELSGASTGCHYKFRVDGSGDVLVVDVELRDPFDVPCVGCEVTCELIPTAGTLAFATCCPNPQSSTSDVFGQAQLRFDSISGRGEIDVEVRADCGGEAILGTETVRFTSTDLDAGAITPAGVTDIFDLGIFAGSLGTAAPMDPPGVYANFNCDDEVDIFDLAFLAPGLLVDCASAVCP